MILFLADTNILGYFSRNNSAHLQQRMALAMQAQTVAISVITRAETRYGVALLNDNDKRRAAIGALLEQFPALPWTPEAADCYGELAATLHKTGQQIGVMDTLIAAHALVNDLTVVTHNTRHFSRVPGLKLEDWMA